MYRLKASHGTFALSLALLAGTALSSPAFAKVEEIFVTAQKREQSVQKVPIPVTALTEELVKSTFRNLSDANGFAPNVRINSDPSRSNAAAISIRGIAPTRTDDNSLDSPVGVMIDNIFLGTLTGQLLESFDLERVEVLRGPQGTLFGRNTVGGVINVIRSRPTGEWGAKAKFTIGSDNRREFRGVFNAPIIQDKLAAKGFVTTIRADGYLDNTFRGGTDPEEDYKNFGITLLATPTDRLEALFTIERFDDKSEIGAFLGNFNLAPGVVPPPSDPVSPNLSGGFLSCLFALTPCRTNLTIPTTTRTDIPNKARTTIDAYTLNASYKISDNLKIVSITGYRDATEDRIVDFDGSSANFITIERNNDYDQLSEEFRLEGKNETGIGKFDWVVGGYYWRSEFSQDWITGGSFWDFVNDGLSGFGFANNVSLGNPAIPVGFTPLQACLAGLLGNVRCDPGVNPLGPGYGPLSVQKLFETQVTTAYAAFGQVDWEFIENWTLTAGLRWTDEKKDFRAGQAYIAPLSRARIDNFPSFAVLSNSWEEITPKYGLSWQATEDLMFYASYSKGFHSGGFFGVNQNVADFVRDQYDPEFAKNIEVGFKSQWFDNTLQLNLSAFRNKFEDKQEQSVQFDPSTNTVATVFDNVASATYKGIEFEGQWHPNDIVNVFLSVGYLDAKYDEFFTDVTPNDGIIGNIQDASFLIPRNAPKWTIGAGAALSYPVGNGTVDAYVKYDWVSEIQSDLLNSQVALIEPTGNLVASLGYTYDGRYSINAFGRNLTNEIAEVPTLIVPLFASSTIGNGRTWGIEFSANF